MMTPKHGFEVPFNNAVVRATLAIHYNRDNVRALQEDASGVARDAQDRRLMGRTKIE
jgi:hypothetical protein